MRDLNFDMLGSPNYVRFVYDGDGADTDPAGPPGSGEIRKVFTDFFDSKGLASDPTEFSGRSDYGPFITVGIPAGGLFSGAEGVKTPEQAAVYGGTAGEAYARATTRSATTSPTSTWMR
jgi:Zn-dependent M28 family amino/carboxypeptidase